MKEDLVIQIEKVLSEWSSEIRELGNRKDIIAINFGAQNVFNGYELYLSGHTWFDGHDLWLLGKDWSPTRNYISIGPSSINYERLYVLETLEKVIRNELIQSSKVYKKFIVTVGLVDSDYIRIK